MLTTEILAVLAFRVGREKRAGGVQRGRSGRTCKGREMSRQLAAAGSPRQNVRGVFSFPRGRNV